jgi:hypothetical protein
MRKLCYLKLLYLPAACHEPSDGAERIGHTDVVFIICDQSMLTPDHVTVTDDAF